MGTNPAWDKLLNAIPTELHSQVTPILQEWDRGVNEQFTKYAPYKALVDNEVNPQFVADAIRFAQDFESDPGAFMAQVNKKLELGFLTADEAAALSKDTGSDDLFGDSDSRNAILESPEFKEMREAVLAMQRQQQEKDEERQQEEALAAFETDIDNFLESKVDSEGKPLNVNKLFFSSLRASGLDNDAAWQQYEKTVADILGKDYKPDEQQDTSGSSQAPAFMGGDGNSGNGSSQDPVNLGSLKNNELDDIVVQMLEAQRQTQGN